MHCDCTKHWTTTRPTGGYRLDKFNLYVFAPAGHLEFIFELHWGVVKGAGSTATQRLSRSKRARPAPQLTPNT